MNRTLIYSMAMALLVTPVASRGNDATTLTGVLLGAAGGLIVADHAHNISRAVAVPMGALLGGLIAHEAQNRRGYDRDYGYWDNRRDYPRSNRYDRDAYPRFERYDRVYCPPPQPPVVVIQEVPVPSVVPSPQPKPPDLHPGVDLIKISVPFSNGVNVDIPVLRIGNKFVGPQGEEYPSLPSAKQLAEKYAK